MTEATIYKGETAFVRVSLPSTSISTFPSKHITLSTLTGSRLQDDPEELEWKRIVNTPHVRSGLSRLAAEARRQFAAGETEEGGFAIE